MTHAEFTQTTIIVDGKAMTIKEFKTIYKTAPKRTRKPQKPQTDKTPLGKAMRQLKQFVSFDKHAERCWGKLMVNFMLKDTHKQFYNVVKSIQDTERAVEEYRKARKRDIPHFALRLTWKLAEVKENLDIFVKDMEKTENLTYFATSEIISGSTDGKRIGLAQLVAKTYNTLKAIEEIAKNLADVANETDIADYDTRGRYRG